MDRQTVNELVERTDKRAAELFDQRMRDPRFRALIASHDGVICDEDNQPRYSVAE